MAHYSLYIPGVKGATDDHLHRVGLGDLVSDGGAEWSDVLANGPDGGHGIVATWRTGHPETDPRRGMIAGEQQWSAGPASADGARQKGAFWIGWETERPPKPGDLIRRKPYAGRHVILRDGLAWLVPETIALPHLVGIDHDTGQVGLKYAPEFAEFCRRADAYAMLICRQMGALELLRLARPAAKPEEVQVDFTLADAYGFCCAALALNYRVNEVIVDALQLVAKPHIVAVLAAAISLPDILAVADEKKNTECVSIPLGSAT